MQSAEQALSFHVYRVGGFLGDDKIVKAQDKMTVKYYLKVSRHDTQWHFTLHVNGPKGTLVCRVSSGYTGPPLCELCPRPMLINITSERQPILVQRRHGLPEGAQWFRGPDDRDYHWQLSSTCLWRDNMQCLDTRGEIVATYRTTAMAISKDGELCIYPLGRFMIDLLVATSLAIRMPNH